MVGKNVGFSEGDIVGVVSVGPALGEPEGTCVGEPEGEFVGFAEGRLDGELVGLSEG